MSGTVKTQESLGFSGLLNARRQVSGSTYDGNSLVGKSTKEGQELRKSFRGQGDSLKTLTDTPSGRQIARHGQTGLFTLSSFVKVKEFGAQPPPTDVPPPPPNPLLSPNQVQPLNQFQPPEAPPSFDQRLSRAFDSVGGLEEKVTDWARERREGGRLDGDRRQRDIFFRDATTKSVAATMAELRRLEQEQRALPPGAQRDQILLELQYAKREAMLIALRLELPGLEIGPTTEESLGTLAGRLVELEEKLIEAGRTGDKALGSATFGADKLLSLLAGFGSTRDLSVGLPGQKRLAVEGLTALVDAILEAVGPGRDGGELNSLLGLNSELDGALKQLRFDAVRDLLANDLCRELDIDDPNDLNQEDKDEIRKQALEIVQLDEEIVRCHRQLGRALRSAGLEDLSTNDLMAVRFDSNMIRGMRNKFGKDGKQIALIAAALHGIEQAGLKSPAVRRLREALNNQLESLPPRQRLNDQQLERLKRITDEYKHLSALKDEAQKRPGNDEQVGLLDARLRALDVEAAGLLALIEDHDRSRLRRRIESLTSEDEPIHRVIEQTRREITQIDERIETLESELDRIDRRYDELLGEAIKERTSLSFDDQIERLTKGNGDLGRDEQLATAHAMSLVQAQRDEIETRLQALGKQRESSVERLNEQSARLEEVARWSSGGFTEEELGQLGLSVGDSRIAETARRLARQGLANTGEVAQLCRDVNSLLCRLGRPQVEQAMKDSVGVLTARSNEVHARELANQLLGSITGSIDVQVGTGGLNDRMKAVLTGDDGLGGRLRGIGHELDGRARQHGRVEREILDLTRALDDYAIDHQTSVDLLTGFEGRKIDPRHPSGLAVSKALLEIGELYSRGRGSLAGLSEEDRQRFHALARQLKGFDPERLEVPFLQVGRHTPRMEDVGAWIVRPGLMDTAQAIVFLRELEPEHSRRIEQAVGRLDEIAGLRETHMGSDDARLVRDTIRAAILHTLLATGARVDSFQPSDHVHTIKRTLQDWGLPVDRLQPEINRALSESFGLYELDLWRETTAPSHAYTAALEARQRTVSQFVEGRDGGRLDPETAKAIFDSIDNLQPSTSVKITVGDRIELQTGMLTSEIVPWMGLNVRLGGGLSAGLEIARSGTDGYELIIRDGIEGKVGTELSIGPSVDGGLLGAMRAEGVGTFDGAHLGVTGVALRFSGARMNEMKETLRNILTTGQITPNDLSSVDNIMPVVETKTGFKVGAHAQFRLKGTEVPQDVLPYSPSLQLRGGVSTGGSWKTYRSENTNLTVTKKEIEKQTEIGTKFHLYFSTGAQSELKNPVPGGGELDPSVYGLEWQGAMQWISKVKTKQTHGLDGLVTSSTEQLHQATLPGGWDKLTPEARRQQLTELGGTAFARLQAKLSDAQRAEIDRMLALAGTGDMLCIGFALDERVRGAVNDLLLQAKAIRAGGGVFSRDGLNQARRLEKDAQALLDDPSNYNPSKLQLIPTRESTNSIGVDGYFAKWDHYVEDKSEWVALEMKFDARVGQEIRNELSSSS